MANRLVSVDSATLLFPADVAAANSTGGGGSTPDATTSVKGKVRLTGDLGGTADAPTVPGLAAKAPLASPTFTGTVSGVTKSHVGLGNVDNTADTAKPVSTAQQTALNLKANLASPAFTGNPTAPTPTAGDNDTSIATTAFVTAAVAAGGGGGGGGGALLAMVPKVGQYLYPAFAVTANTGTISYATGQAPGAPILVQAPFTAGSLMFRVDTAEAVNVRALLYSSDADGHPATLVAHGTASASTVGTVTVTFSGVVLPAGIYWAFLRTNGGTTVRFRGVGSNGGMTTFGGVDSVYRDRNPVVWADVGTYAAPLASLTGLSYNIVAGNDIPLIALGRSA